MKEEQLLNERNQLQRAMEMEENNLRELRSQLSFLDEAKGQLKLLQEEEQAILEEELHYSKGSTVEREVHINLLDTEDNYQRSFQLFYQKEDELQEKYGQTKKSINDLEEKLAENRKEALKNGED